MITLNFSVEDQLLTRTDENTVAANSHLVHVCEFTFSSEWDGRGKVATFKKRDLMLSVILEDDACTIPPEILQSENKIDVFELSVCGADGNSTITSTVVKVPILAGTWDVMSTEITPTMFEQIMQKIDEVEKGEVSPELIYEAVSEYMGAHPLEPIVAEDVAAYFEAHKSEFKGDKGDTGATPNVTATAEVNNAVGTPSVTVTKTGTDEAPNLNFAFQNLKGAKGDTGVTPTVNASATVDANVGTPSVTVTKSGTTENPNLAFAFHNLKGVKGDTGNGIVSIEKTATSGLVDTYTITYADGSTSTYEVTNGRGADEVWKAQGQLGAKNLLKYPYYGTTRSYEGIEFTDNKGVITINGISTSSANYYLRYNEPIYLEEGTYILSVKNPLGNSVRIQMVYKNGSGEQILASITRNTLSQQFIITDDIISNAEYWYIRIVVLSNAQVDNLVVAPMICLANDTDITWQPYALTNREITERVNAINKSNVRYKLTVGSSNGYDYTSLTDAVIAASEATNTDVYVSDGTYDLYSEFIEKYGANYFNSNNFTSQPNCEGLPLNNGVNLYFSSGAKVVCVLPVGETSETVQQTFSAFKLNGTDAGLYNLDLYCKNTRYSIHDEASGQGSYHHVYKDCRIEQVRDQGAFGYENCIGGGCGLHGRIDIENCYFKGAVANGYSLTWHNGSQPSAQSYIFISNSYFEQGKIRFRYYGVSDLISRMTVSGCNIPYDIDEPAPETGTSTTVNTEIVKWNNIIRTA